jgi:hypothetical protein
VIFDWEGPCLTASFGSLPMYYSASVQLLKVEESAIYSHGDENCTNLYGLIIKNSSSVFAKNVSLFAENVFVLARRC